MVAKPKVETRIPEVELLLQLLSTRDYSASKIAIERIVSQNIDWTVFNELVVYHRLCPLVADRYLHDLQTIISHSSIALVIAEAAVVRRKALMLLSEAVRLQQAFAKEGIVALFIKGPVAALSIYHEFKQRGFNDLDILVQPEDVSAACRLLERLSYVSGWPPHLANSMSSNKDQSASRKLLHLLYETTFFSHNKIALIDLHWQVLPGRLQAELLFKYRQQLVVGKNAIETLDPTVHFIVICEHSAKHRWCRLVWVCDIARVMDNPDKIDWQKAADLAKKWSVYNSMLASMHVAHSLLGAPLPDHSAWRTPLGTRIARQIQIDLIPFAKGSPDRTQHDVGLIEQATRTWRLSDDLRPALLTIARDSIRPSPWIYFVLKLPPRFFSLYYLANPCLRFMNACRQWVRHGLDRRSKTTRI